jgi:hypothetical protein
MGLKPITLDNSRVYVREVSTHYPSVVLEILTCTPKLNQNKMATAMLSGYNSNTYSLNTREKNQHLYYKSAQRKNMEQ